MDQGLLDSVLNMLTNLNGGFSAYLGPKMPICTQDAKVFECFFDIARDIFIEMSVI